MIHTDIKSDPLLIEKVSAHIGPLPNVHEVMMGLDSFQALRVACVHLSVGLFFRLGGFRHLCGTALVTCLDVGVLDV